eukprot:COSAG01_NODE_8036_length_2946_cov_5.061819_2_plen_88_part_00
METPGQVLRTQLPPAVRHAGEAEADRRRAEQGVALTDAELGGGAMRALSPGAVIDPRLQQQQQQSSRTRYRGQLTWCKIGFDVLPYE